MAAGNTGVELSRGKPEALALNGRAGQATYQSAGLSNGAAAGNHAMAHVICNAFAVLVVAGALVLPPSAARADDPVSVEGLLKDGWEIAGYASNFEGRSLILFKHKDKSYLAQCSVLYDVTRTNRVVTNCYEVR